MVTTLGADSELLRCLKPNPSPQYPIPNSCEGSGLWVLGTPPPSTHHHHNGSTEHSRESSTEHRSLPELRGVGLRVELTSTLPVPATHPPPAVGEFHGVEFPSPSRRLLPRLKLSMAPKKTGLAGGLTDPSASSSEQKRILDDLEVLDTSELPLLKHPRSEQSDIGLPYLSEPDVALSSTYQELEDISIPITEEAPLFLIIGERLVVFGCRHDEL